ncbi:MAG: hypothetical protein D6795_17865 [Deltaproteobacteria bacterium]|nr:MAG: hypothetical protein D6795_17865 [Deltaproteobacteria bacterium]
MEPVKQPGGLKRSTLGVILLIVVAGALAVVWKVVAPRLAHRQQKELIEATSDARKFSDTLNVAGDSWLGYFVLRSPYFRRLMQEGGVKYQFLDDHARYAERMAKFAKGAYDIVVATVDSYLLNARGHQYPGVILFVIDESNGGDAIVAGPKVATIDDLNHPRIRIAFTPDSPSEFLLKATASHFNLEILKHPGPWRVETEGAEEALAKLRANAVDAAVLWEPEVSRALKLPGVKKLTSTAESDDLIIDILVAHRRLVKEKPELVARFVKAYFEALYYYRKDEEILLEQAANDAKTASPEDARTMLSGIELVNFTENCHYWFGIGEAIFSPQEKLPEIIEDTVAIFRDTGDLDGDPLEGDPYRIMNSGFLADLYTTGFTGGSVLRSKFSTPPPGEASPTPSPLPPISEAAWEKLRRVGTLKILPVYFTSGSDLLTAEDKLEIDRIAKILAHYPRYRILVEGHSSPGADPAADRELSLRRAEVIRQYLVRVHGIDPNRIRAVGLGSERQLPRKPGESYRAYRARNQRAEFVFLEDPF